MGAVLSEQGGRETAPLLPRPEGAALPDRFRSPLRPRAGLGTRGQDQHLGPGLAALRRGRLQVGRAGRLGDPLADLLSRRRSLLRQGRGADRGLRGGRRFGDPPRQQVPATRTRTPLRRAPPAKGLREDGHPHGRGPPGQHDPAHAWLCSLPLLRALLGRLRHLVVLQLRRSPPAFCPRHRQARAAIERGRGPGAGGRPRPRPRRPVLRPQDRGGATGPGQGGGGGRERHGLDPPPAELQVDRLPERYRQRVGRDRPLPLRAGADQREGRPDRPRGHTPPPRQGHRRRARLLAALQPRRSPQARLPPRLRHPVLEHRRVPGRRSRRELRPRLRRCRSNAR